MDKLIRMLTHLAKVNGGHWELGKNRLSIPVGAGGQRQEIRFERSEEEYFLTSIVMGSHEVTQNANAWRELAIVAWQRNAAHELVTFAFDSHERLVGQIRHPAAHLDLEELECYVNSLVLECDRFRYLLTGKAAIS